MKRSSLLLVFLVAALVAYWWYRQQGEEFAAVNLVERFAELPDDAKRTNVADRDTAIATGTLSIEGDTKPILFMHPTSRVTFRLTVPYDGWFRAWVALRPEAWTEPGDGVLFRMAISDGRSYDELINVHVDPANTPGDRRWIEVSADLSAYAGQAVDLILNTNSSLPLRGDDSRSDWAVWGAPQVFVRR
jgi:hypothetical protein